MIKKSQFVIFLTGFVILLMHSCVPPSNKEVKGDPVQDFNQELVKKIYSFQDAQRLDSLKLFLESSDPMARFCATKALGSFITKEATPLIRKRLQDSVFEIRAEAAYVAGQSGDTTLAADLLGVFESDMTKEVDHLLNLHILEAIGKIGPKSYLSFLAQAEPYDKKYEQLNTGRALAFYHYALRGMTDEKATLEMLKFATEEYPGKSALIAANYLHRAKDLDLESIKFQLLQGLINIKDPHVRMCMATAVGKCGSKDVLAPFMDQLRNEKDSRVVVNAIRQFHHFKYIEVIDEVLNYLSNPNVDIALTASDYLKYHGQFGDAGFYLEYIEKVNNPLVKIKVKGAILSLLKRNFSSTRRKLYRELSATFEETEDPYLRAAAIEAIGSNPYLFQEVHDLAFKDSILVVRTKGVEAIGSILTSFLPSESRAQQRYLAPIAMNFLHEALTGEDVGMIAAAAYSIAQTDNALIDRYKDKAILEQAISRLSMPKDIEAINYCIEAINKHFPESKLDKKKASKLRDFDINAMDRIADDVTAIVQTSKGDFTLKLFKETET